MLCDKYFRFVSTLKGELWVDYSVHLTAGGTVGPRCVDGEVGVAGEAIDWDGVTEHGCVSIIKRRKAIQIDGHGGLKLEKGAKRHVT